MVNRVLIDTNVLLDYMLAREPYCEDAKKVILSCTEGDTKGCIAAHSISNMFFILRKDYTSAYGAPHRPDLRSKTAEMRS